MSSTSYGSITVSNLRSITNVVNYYLATSESSGVTKSTDGWTTGIQTMTSTNQYLWNYEETILGDGTVLSSTSPIIIGRYGQNGGTGRGIAQIQEHYLATSASSGVTTSTSGWKDTVQATTSTNRYLWNYETITWTSGTPLTTDTDPRIIGTHGLDGRTYSIEFSNSSIKQDAGGTFTPSTVTVTAYYRDGTSTRQTYAGRIHVVGNKSDGSMVVIQNASSATNKATYTLTPNATYVSYTISLYAAGGATTLLAIETLPIVSDGTSVTSVTTSKSGDETTITISMSDGTSKQFKVKDGGKGDTGATAQWYYGDKLSHTSGSVTKTTSDTATPDAVVGSMYLNPNTSLCYRCTAISGSNATWTYAGDLTTGVINNIEIGGRNLLIGSIKYREDTPFINTSKNKDGVKYDYTVITKEKAVVGQQYIMQAKTDGVWAASHGSQDPQYVTIWLVGTKDKSSATSHQVLTTTTYGDVKYLGDGKWLWTAPASWEDCYISIRINTYNTDGTTSVTHSFWDFKLEYGNIPTDWTPAPEDVESSISSVNTTLSNYITSNNAALDAVKNQADASFDTWFYSGQPTANNAPANTWTDNTKKALHVGDMYYDTATGKAYTYNSSYQWVAQSSSNIASTDAITAAKNLANSKIKTYAVAAQPTSGMSSGDLWIDTDDNNRMYRYNGSTWVDVQTEINVGGRNLLRLTKNPEFTTQNWNIDPIKYTGWSRWNSNWTVVTTDDGIKGSCPIANAPSGFCIPLVYENAAIGGTEYTLSFDYRTNLSTFGSIYLLVNSGSNVLVDATSVTASETNWQHYKQTITWPSTSGKTTRALLIPYANTTNNVWIEIKNSSMKLEKGNVATDWSPAPEDIETEVSALRTDLQSQIDEKIQTYYQSTNPNSWAAADRESHDGDLWYYTGDTTSTLTKGNVYRYNASSNSWVIYSASGDLFDKIDGKSTIFYGTTSGTYTGVQVGDYLVDSTDGSTYRYSGSSWVKVTDYKTGIDEAKQDVVDLDTSLNQQEVFNRLTNNKNNQGLIIENGNVYLNASMINTGYFTVTDNKTGKELFRAGSGEDGSVVSIKALDDLGVYFDFTDDGLIIGRNNYDIKLHITNNRLSFKNKGQEVAYISSDKLYINSAEIEAKNNGNLQLGNFAFIPQSNGNLSFRKVK